MKIPVQSKPVTRRAGASNFAAGDDGIMPQDVCSTACGILKSACNKIPFVPGSVCNAIFNCCTGACEG